MPRTSLPEIQRRYESDAGAISAWYNLDVGWLLGENQRLRAALEVLAEHAGDAWSREQARRALGQELEVTG